MGALVFNDPCLVAVWPGMGCVAEIAGAYLTQKLGARPFAEIGPAPYFDLRQAHVKDGLLLPAALPRSVFYAWRNPNGGRDVVILLGESQPPYRAWAFCQELVAFVQALGVRRRFTFSAVASPSGQSLARTVSSRSGLQSSTMDTSCRDIGQGPTLWCSRAPGCGQVSSTSRMWDVPTTQSL